MNPENASILRALLRQRSVVALGTLQEDEPYVSMVPFAVTADGKSLIIHASRLAAHTRNMKRNERVSVLVAEAEGSGKMAQSLARVTIQGISREVGTDADDYPRWREAYLTRFPSAAPMFGFADFSLFLIDVTSARLVAGFAQALTLSAQQFAAAVADLAGET
ncbi:MAG: pyridoxamine 5'-phosphate oxidase family protein [Planctomycetes bacterium]|nr:pyridoxamine 5'-phosphate oxidase family protein [Planctomycetota bacterium]